MRCARCHRPLTIAAVSITTRAGTRNYGPKCAAIAGLIDAKPRRGLLNVKHRQPVADSRQLPLEYEEMEQEQAAC